MPAAALDKVFEHLHTAHESLARVVGRRHPCLASGDRSEKDPLKSGKQLQAAILRYDAVATNAPAAYKADAAQYGICSEAAVRLAEGAAGRVAGVLPYHAGPAARGAGAASKRSGGRHLAPLHALNVQP